MNFFDLHCDTVFESVTKNKSLINGELCVNINKILKFDKYKGCFAIWIPDDFDFEKSLCLFHKCIDMFKIYKINMNNIIISVEGGKILGNNIKNISLLKNNNVKILTLTWNGKCNIGDGCFVQNPQGITKFGKMAIQEFENNDIVIDLSHSSEKLFYDVCEITSKPFIFSHSNSKKIYNHVRNITDEQFKVLMQRSGIIGVNFCKEFLNNKNQQVEDLFEHIDHFMSLGGENTVCIGSDFDGSKVLDEFKDILDIYKLYDFLIKKNYSENLINKIFYENANEFFNSL